MCACKCWSKFHCFVIILYRSSFFNCMYIEQQLNHLLIIFVRVASILYVLDNNDLAGCYTYLILALSLPYTCLISVADFSSWNFILEFYCHLTRIIFVFMRGVTCSDVVRHYTWCSSLNSRDSFPPLCVCIPVRMRARAHNTWLEPLQIKTLSSFILGTMSSVVISSVRSLIKSCLRSMHLLNISYLLAVLEVTHTHKRTNIFQGQRLSKSVTTSIYVLTVCGQTSQGQEEDCRSPKTRVVYFARRLQLKSWCLSRFTCLLRPSRTSTSQSSLSISVFALKSPAARAQDCVIVWELTRTSNGERERWREWGG